MNKMDDYRFILFTRKEKRNKMNYFFRTYHAFFRLIRRPKDIEQKFKDEVVLPEALIARVFSQICQNQKP